MLGMSSSSTLIRRVRLLTARLDIGTVKAAAHVARVLRIVSFIVLYLFTMPVKNESNGC